MKQRCTKFVCSRILEAKNANEVMEMFGFRPGDLVKVTTVSAWANGKKQGYWKVSVELEKVCGSPVLAMLQNKG